VNGICERRGFERWSLRVKGCSDVIRRGCFMYKIEGYEYSVILRELSVSSFIKIFMVRSTSFLSFMSSTSSKTSPQELLKTYIFAS